MTEVDKAVEEFITRKIKAAYPDHKLYAHLISLVSFPEYSLLMGQHWRGNIRRSTDHG